MKENTGSSRRREYENAKNLEYNKLYVIYTVLLHVCRMVNDRKFRAPIWAQLAVSSQKQDLDYLLLIQIDSRAWLEKYMREAERNQHDPIFSPRCMAALASIYAHSLRQMTEHLNIYDQWTKNSLENAFLHELDQDQSANLLEFWCDTRLSGDQRRELIKESIKTESPAAAL